MRAETQQTRLIVKRSVAVAQIVALSGHARAGQSRPVPGRALSNKRRTIRRRAAQRSPISVEQERRLVGRCRASRAARARLSSGRGLTRDLRCELLAQAADGELALETLIRCHARLVARIASAYEGRGIELDDLRQEGTIALMHAIEKFHSVGGARLAHYAAWWVQHAIERAILNQARAIRLPVHTAQLSDRVLATRQHLFCRLAREPSAREIAGALDAPPEQIAAIVRAHAQALPMGGRAARAAEALTDPALLPEELTLERERARILLQCASELDEPDRQILLGIYGIAGRTPKTLDELSRAHNLTRNNIRWRHHASLEALGRAPRLIKLV